MRRVPENFEVMDDVMADVMRRKTPAERLAIVFGMWDWAHDLLVNAMRGQHPEWDDQRLSAEVARRLLRESD